MEVDREDLSAKINLLMGKMVNQLHLVLFSATMNHPHSHGHAAHFPSSSSIRISCAPQQLHTPWYVARC